MSTIVYYSIHTELIHKLGPIEWIFNTPSHHRVHHGRNPEYLDRNYAGILIVWDRLSGSFEPETEAVDYGLTKNLDSFNPVEIAFHEWRAIAKDLGRAGSIRAGWGTLFRAPGWKADGSGLTSKQLRTQHDTAH